MDFANVVRLVANFLDKGGFPYAVAGAIALQAYGLARATQDVDLITDASARESLVPFLKSQGYETLHSSQGYSTTCIRTR